MTPVTSRLLAAACVVVFVCAIVVAGKGAKEGEGKKLRHEQRAGQRAGQRAAAGASSTAVSAEDKERRIDSLGKFWFRNASHEEKLLEYLFHDYEPVARGVMDTSATVHVNIDFVLLRIHGLDERSQVLTVMGLVIAEWHDDRLKWNPEKFGGIKDIIIKAEKIWLPEIAVMNGAEELIPDFDRIRVLLNHDGKLHWEPGGIFRTTCDIDITFFPFDTQACPLLIGAYSYYSTKMNISNMADDITTYGFQPNGEWEVFHTKAVWGETILDCCPDQGYPHVIFTLHLKRRYRFYMMNIILPCIMLSILIMVGFFLPPDAGEKISLGISVLLAFTVFLIMVADNIPRTSLAIPLMVIYLTATMTLGTMSIVMTVVVLNFHNRRANIPVPGWVTSVLGFISKVLCMRPLKCKLRLKRRQQMLGNGNVMKHIHPMIDSRRNSLASDIGDDHDYSEEWREVATILDRFFFWIVFILFLFSGAGILLYPKYSGAEQMKIEQAKNS